MQNSNLIIPLDSLNHVLSRFEPIGVEDMEHAHLQNRKESKYLLTTEQALLLISHLPDSYRVFEVDSERVQTYRTTYYDSPELSLYLDHHNGKKHRFKVRTRSYIGSDLNFLEVKEKINTGRTIKHRLQTDSRITRLGADFKDFLSSYLPLDYSQYRPVLINGYHRITLVSPIHPERITLDVNLTFRHGSTNIILPDIAIAELKRSTDYTRSPALDYLNTMRLRPKRFSKYCIGISLLYGNVVKHNNFNSTLRFLNKLMHGGPIRC